MFRTKNIVSLLGRQLQYRWYSTHASPIEKKVTLLDIAKKHKENIPLTMVTAYDYTSAYFVDKASVDVILVGDSLGMVMLGRDNTTEVTMDEMLHHCKAVARGSKRAFVVGDMPFGSFEVSSQEAVHNACRLVKEGHVAAVKLEGGKIRRNTVQAIVQAGIPVIGHIGLTPQTCGSFGGFKVQGKSAKAAASIFEDALALQDAGCSAIVIEFVPELLGQAITKGLTIPTFGIGAGKHTSGQVLVYHDMLGMYPDFTPKFCKQYANIGEEINKGLTSFKQEVETRQFPAAAHSFSMKPEEFEKAADLILQSLPEKEGVDREVANSLLQMKASLVETKEKEKEKESQKSENSSSLSSTSSITYTSSISSTYTTPSVHANYDKIIPTTNSKINDAPEIPKNWIANFVTNFDLYYNSYYQHQNENVDEKEKERNTSSSFNSGKKKMKA